MDPKFKKGERVKTDSFDKIGVVIEIVERPEEYATRYKYLVEFKKRGWFGEKVTTEWIYEGMLDKFLTQ